jgi:hypothetical protein
MVIAPGFTMVFHLYNSPYGRQKMAEASPTDGWFLATLRISHIPT